MRNYPYAIKQALTFSNKEIRQFLIVTLVSGFLMSFGLWGDETLDILVGLTNMILYTLFFALIYFIFIAAQKYVGGLLGYETRFELWTYAPLIGLVITFMVYGFIPPGLNIQFFFLYLGNVKLKDVPKLRLGKYHRWTTAKDLLYVGIAGPMAVLLLMIVVIEPLFFISSAALFRTAMFVSAAIIFFSSLPIPHANGINLILKYRWVWILIFAIGILLLLLLMPMNIYAYIVAAILMAILAWLYGKLVSNYY